jgi:NADPH:quinone reductase-like Zn-dependent oxidoreductase
MRNLKVLRWTAKALALMLALGVVALFIAYWRSDNDCEERRASAPKNPMRAAQQCDYGGPEQIHVEHTEKPAPSDDEILVRVAAAALNFGDVYKMRGPYMARPMIGLRRPGMTRMGVDFAGTVEAVGKNVTGFQAGDEVFGGVRGAVGEYVLVRADRAVVKKPANVSLDEAGAVGVAGVTALQAVRDHAKVQAGEKVLINGASGGVGTFAVQIAKALGAEVTGVASTRNQELVRALGADYVIDYSREDFTQGAERYDVIIDIAAHHDLSALRRALKPTGRYVLVGAVPNRSALGPLGRVAKMKVYSWFVEQPFIFFIARLNKADLEALRDMMEAGKLKPSIDRRYPLEQIGDAMRYMEEGHARGKVVVTVAE